MTRMTGPECAVMCNLINTHTHTKLMNFHSDKSSQGVNRGEMGRSLVDNRQDGNEAHRLLY